MARLQIGAILKLQDYKIMKPNIELAQDSKNNIQAIDFLENTKQCSCSLSLLLKKFMRNYSWYAAILHDTTHKYFN
jgi:hypothetical protein